MDLIDSPIENVEQQAQKTIKDAISNAKELYSDVAGPNGCLETASEKAKGVKENLGNLQSNVSDVKNIVLSQVQDQIDSLKKKLKGAASSIDDRLEKKMKQALSEGIDIAMSEAGIYADAIKAAMNLIYNNINVVAIGAMYALLKRAKRDLESLEKKLVRANRLMEDIRAAAQVLQSNANLIGGATDTDLGSLSEAEEALRSALRDLRLARTIYLQEGVLEDVPTRDAKRDVEEAGMILSESELLQLAGNAVKGAVSDDDMIENLPDSIKERVQGSADSVRDQVESEIKRQIETMKKAKSAIGEIPSLFVDILAKYQVLKQWSELARQLPDSIEAIGGIAQLISVDERLYNLRTDIHDLYQEVQLNPQSVKKRAELSSDAAGIVAELEALLAATTSGPQADEEVYEEGMRIFNASFFTGESFKSTLRDIGIQKNLLENASKLADSVEFAVGAVTPLGNALTQTQSILYEVNRALDAMENQPSMFTTILDLLKVAGIAKPIEAIITGQLPKNIKRLLDRARLGVSLLSSAQNPCGVVDNTKIPGSDQDQMYAAALDQARQNKARLASAGKSMSDSNRLSTIKQFGLSGADTI